jgi:hypothetical protein
MTDLKAMLLDELALKYERTGRPRIDFECSRDAVGSSGYHGNLIGEGKQDAHPGSSVTEFLHRLKRHCPALIIEPHCKLRKQFVADEPGKRWPSATVCQKSRQGRHK